MPSRSRFTVIGWQVTTGGVLSRIEMTCTCVAELPQPSLTVQVRVIVLSFGQGLGIAATVWLNETIRPTGMATKLCPGLIVPGDSAAGAFHTK